MTQREKFEQAISLAPWIIYDEVSNKYKLSEKAYHSEINIEILVSVNFDWKIWQMRDAEIAELESRIKELESLVMKKDTALIMAQQMIGGSARQAGKSTFYKVLQQAIEMP